MEKLIQEFRVIETDDGFRIELKGDKERMRSFVTRMDPRRRSGGRAAWGHGHRGRHGCGPKTFLGFGIPPWMYGDWYEEEDEEDVESEA